MENLLSHLKALGFNSYEAKVYLSLLKKSPATGYEVSKESGVPQARAYDTLKVLESRHIVVPTGTKPVAYRPIDPKVLLANCEKDFKSSIDYLSEQLPSGSGDFIEPIVNITGAPDIFKKINEMIDSAEKEIFLEAWPDDIEKIIDALKRANERGVDIKAVGYDDVEMDFGMLYQHGLAKAIENSLGGRWVILSVDNSEGMIGTFSENDNVQNAIATKNVGIILIIKEFIVHDIYLLDLESKLGDTLTQIYGKDLVRLREKILGKDFQFYAH